MRYQTHTRRHLPNDPKRCYLVVSTDFNIKKLKNLRVWHNFPSPNKRKKINPSNATGLKCRYLFLDCTSQRTGMLLSRSSAGLHVPKWITCTPGILWTIFSALQCNGRALSITMVSSLWAMPLISLLFTKCRQPLQQIVLLQSSFLVCTLRVLAFKCTTSCNGSVGYSAPSNWRRAQKSEMGIVLPHTMH